MGYGEIIRRAREKKGLSQEELAKILGVSRVAITNYELEKNPPTYENVKKLSEILDIPEQFLFDKSKTLDIIKKAIQDKDPDALSFLKSQYPAISETIEVPLLNHEVSAGHGIEPFETEVIDTLLIDKEKLLPEYPPERLKGLKVRGNSMEPYVKNGDIVIMYRFNWDEPLEKIDDIYVINYDNQLMVKQIQFVGGSKIRIVSINPTYPPIELDMDDNQVFFAILGKVVLRILRG
ncbi:repressor LexA [Nitratiruptor phage NrS-5]|uniref:XRE family transcriptional regulator n=1 Tax=unclassified Nitratiruptor TaxID=2624044 RepID=UPI0019160B2F|nr:MULTISPECIES: XRE family transcriptional regulator [unclassified Nitratiruptor]BCD61726.1 repressor LexA [Nitratiruptor sp. YY08-13]BCD65661.1 repressor LexA [Nitratiruptor sp. YY08-26]BCD83204.1 repressor LexA [Nitratiruptor phage NrS-4]BCD83263.1 repressor LexA [Nitratiruptor phage NrS-5]